MRSPRWREVNTKQRSKNYIKNGELYHDAQFYEGLCLLQTERQCSLIKTQFAKVMNSKHKRYFKASFYIMKKLTKQEESCWSLLKKELFSFEDD